ncbi:Thiol-disulfide oxidoreductase ResA [Crateriforma conspicua]|uniref:Thiol-disulfide oxidoreductase ResA n=2 Tax=Crateriforma TaxID=2714592 RepID=A0A5C6FTZ9_9PLAN|nr:TlpA disulfide reductase family protein [Crateriforma conspicua]TWU65811.1 Thiol-disulfide oxidoreductase ResA [Crateriforma conspicua]
MTRFSCYRPPLLTVLSIAVALSSSHRTPMFADGILTLSDHQTIVGQVADVRIPAPDGPILGWQGVGFNDPFVFPIDRVKKLEFQDANEINQQQATFAVELYQGDLLTCDLLSIDADQLVLKEPDLGKLQIPLDAVHRLYRVADNPTLVFAHLAGLQDWSGNHWNNEGWFEEGIALGSDRADAVLMGDLGVPNRAIIELELSWKGAPNFHVSLGCDPTQSPEVSSGWAITSIGRTLAVFRERQHSADLDILTTLEDDSSIRLIAFLDQDADTITVYHSDGSLAGQLAAEPKDDEATEPSDDLPRVRIANGTGISVTNREGTTYLRRLRVAKWIGDAGPQSDTDDAVISVVTIDGKVVTGRTAELTSDGESLVMAADQQQESIAMKQIAGINFPRPSDIESADDAIQQKDIATLLLGDGGRLLGRVQKVTPTHIQIRHAATGHLGKLPRQRVRLIHWREHPWQTIEDDLSVLQQDDHRTLGRLTAAINAAADGDDGERRSGLATLAWQARGSQTAASFAPSVSGVIRKPSASVSTAKTNSATPDPSGRSQIEDARKRLTELRENRSPDPATATTSSDRSIKDAPSSGPAKDAFTHHVYLVSGDHFSCDVLGVAKDGLQIRSAESGVSILPDNQIKAVQFDLKTKIPNLEQAKRQRLLTLPRSQHDSPPTHLLIAANGDMMRCQMVSIDEDAVAVTARMHELSVPRNRITQIIWLHPEDLLASKENKDSPTPSDSPDDRNPETRFDDHIQAVFRNGNDRLTFVPAGLDDPTLVGRHGVFGDCQVDLNQLERLVLGRAIGQASGPAAYGSWVMKLAKEPVVAAAMRGELTVPPHPLNGQKAPEINLPLVEGGRFRLSEYRGEIVLVDFWASWCAPCMQTMPKVDEVAAQYESELVRLMTINVSDADAQIRSSLRRMNIQPEVAMDIDGIAAERYQADAIPQLVVIDREGNVAGVFVGGGDFMIARLKSLLDSMTSPEANVD